LVPELLAAGHEVVGLARSDASAAALTAAGVEVHRGSLDDLDALSAAAAAADGVIHLAFDNEQMLAGNYDGAVAADLRAVEALGEALVGSDKPFVSTSGTLMLTFAGLDRVGTEADVVAAGPRVDAENAVIALAARGVRSSIVRLPPTVHSPLDHHGFVPILIRTAREHRVAAYVGDGANRWPAGHTLDAARLYRAALEHAPAGSRLHAVGDEGIPLRTIAESIGHHLEVPVASIPAETSAEHFGSLGLLVMLDNPTSSTATQQLVPWRPTEIGLLADLDQGHYFADPTPG
jgi:nucleoside-diphosphate-sugar epimerase